MPDEKNDTVTVRLKNEHDKARLISELGRCSIDIDSFAVSEPTLGDIFVRYAGGSV